VTRLWWVNPGTYHPTAAGLALLTAEERTQHQRFLIPAKQHEYLVTRVLIRTVLGHALGIAPGAVPFEQNEWGRPSLPSPATLRFNLTHTDGLVLCLLSDEHEVGVDTELISRAPTLLRLAPRVFAPNELAELHALPPEQQLHRAVTLWTLKESYIKARGMGLALALDGFAFRFHEGGVRLEVEPALHDDGARWQFETRTLGPHLVSTALSQPAAKRVEIEVVEATLP
jgi:4'-phosphopantetheinyl transferase